MLNGKRSEVSIIEFSSDQLKDAIVEYLVDSSEVLDGDEVVIDFNIYESSFYGGSIRIVHGDSR